MTTSHRTQEPSTRSTVVAPTPNPLTTGDISLDDLAAVTGGAGEHLLYHELAHVVQQDSRR